MRTTNEIAAILPSAYSDPERFNQRADIAEDRLIEVVLDLALPADLLRMTPEEQNIAAARQYIPRALRAEGYDAGEEPERWDGQA